jgi:hypothetical protein
MEARQSKNVRRLHGHSTLHGEVALKYSEGERQDAGDVTIATT